jgi:hypothetical protein
VYVIVDSGVDVEAVHDNEMAPPSEAIAIKFVG